MHNPILSATKLELAPGSVVSSLEVDAPTYLVCYTPVEKAASKKSQICLILESQLWGAARPVAVHTRAKGSWKVSQGPSPAVSCKLRFIVNHA